MKIAAIGCSFFLTAMFMVTGTQVIAQPDSIPIETVDSSMRALAKPVLVLLTTDWCKYCQLQKAQLKKNRDFQGPEKSFYYVEFNAEEKAPVTFHEQTYTYKVTGVSTGLHELAVALSGDKSVSFPSWVLLNKDYQVLFRYNGVLSTQQLKDLLNAINRLQQK